jgi:hypothetical protein
MIDNDVFRSIPLKTLMENDNQVEISLMDLFLFGQVTFKKKNTKYKKIRKEVNSIYILSHKRKK